MRNLRRRYWKIVLVIQLTITVDFAYTLWVMPRTVYADIGSWVILALVLNLLTAGETWRDRHAP
jgi:hypothetical protein